MQLLIGLGVGLVLFLCTIKAYLLGLQHGKQLSKADIPKIELNPIKSFKQHIEEKEKKKQTDLVEEGFMNIMNYDGTPQGGDD